ncbi:MAG: Gfo/Idh/MocA family oxidoreductase, partial [Chlamydiia bacterium]|nr:Gfo/Idh/MocA family oxidoreductase [Chlamydiia bacterium]
LRIGFIGAGYIARVQMRVLQRLQRDVELVAVADCSPDACASFATEHSPGLLRPSSASILEDPSIDVVHICTPNHLHFEQTLSALAHGKHVFSEKPLAVSLDQAAQLVEAAHGAGTHCGVNFCYRYYPVVQEAAERVRQGALGSLLAFTGSYFQDHLLGASDYNWRLDPSQSGPSSVIADLGCHWFHLLEFVTQQRITAVHAQCMTHHKQRHNGSKTVDCPLEDVGALLIRLEGGAVGTFCTSQMAAGRKCAIDLQIYGSESSLTWNHEQPSQLWTGNRRGANQLFWESPVLQSPVTRPFAQLPSGHPMGYHDAMYNLFRCYYDAILGRPAWAPYPTFAEGMRQVAIVEAAVNSSQQNAWADVNTPVCVHH